jgi:hypothetical protein
MRGREKSLIWTSPIAIHSTVQVTKIRLRKL